ncbi:hypothetical protein F3Y22_tig00110020pilonHSYRG00533 [Hibiscus syriacus]|uniref:Leucine-rich repeat-containing N-terminal plant-type domain-containing protein n=1 Tax=Hibiscus syriacus TaxID=106335 RepID=A0A6A3BT17_HIBSY|nr:hypothetical protein F3Y22_tig00110020pilonHSYRG00533 [Hibiscus syriacus]
MLYLEKKHRILRKMHIYKAFRERLDQFSLNQPVFFHITMMKPPFLLSLMTFFWGSSLLVLSASSLPLPLISLLLLKSSLEDHIFSFRDRDPTPAFSKPGFEHPFWCSWSGVKGNPKTAQVTFLRIFNGYSNDFEGPLSIEFLWLRFLEQLNLEGSYFEDEIAAISGRFTRLMLLDLAGNVLEGTLPCQLGFLTQLERIEIGYNALKAPY